MPLQTNVPKILVCGGRNFGKIIPYNPHPDKVAEYRFVHTILENQIQSRGWVYDDEYKMPNVYIISGGATGADAAAIDYAVVNYLPFKEYQADWETHGRKAGILRNIAMLKDSDPDLVIAFPGSRGTAHMIKIALEAGKEVIEVKYDV